MTTSKTTEEIEAKLGINNHSDGATLKKSKMVGDIMSYMEREKITVFDILRTQENPTENTFSEAWQNEMGYSLDELRMLKQALNTNLCLAVFNKTLAQTGGFSSEELPYRYSDGESGAPILVPISKKEFFTERGELFKINRKKLSLAERYSVDFKKILTDIIPASKTLHLEAKITNAYLLLFFWSLKGYFADTAWRMVTYQDESPDFDISTVYYFLECYIQQLFYKQFDTSYTSLTSTICLDTSLFNLVNYIYRCSKEEKYLPDSTELSNFLTEQGSSERKNIGDHLKTRQTNEGRIYFDETERVYKPQNREPIDCEDTMQPLGKCPFAQVRDASGKNALKHMHEWTNSQFIKVINGLIEEGTYNP